MSALCPVPALRPPDPAPQSRWLQVVSHLDPKFGGIASLLPMFCAAADWEGVRSPVLGFCSPRENWDQINNPGCGLHWQVSYVPADRVRWMMDPIWRNQAKELIRNSDGVHIHGIWETHCAIGSELAHACRRPYILSAHGMLERWCLQSKRLKKALYATLVEMENLRRAACLRALTRAEVSDYRRIGLTNPIAVVPSGVSIPANISPATFLEAHPNLSGKRLTLFLGRLHPKKGLAPLLRAWQRSARLRDGEHLVIAGPDFEGTRANLESLAAELGITRQVTFVGMLSGTVKWSALAAADLFVLPSFSEGFSIAVLEALGMGLPSIVTRGCNIPEVAEHDCGWIVQPEEQALAGALTESFGTSAARLKAIGDRGRALVAARYSWSVIGKQMADVYRWVLNGPLPADVPIYKGL